MKLSGLLRAPVFSMRRIVVLLSVLPLAWGALLCTTVAHAAPRHTAEVKHAATAHSVVRAKRSPATLRRLAVASVKGARSLRATGRRILPARERRVPLRTARALRGARRQGTEAVRAAARAAAIQSAQAATPDDQPHPAAALTVPEVPALHYANLPPLRGSHESLVRQNLRAEKDGLLRIQDDADIERLHRLGSLVRLPINGNLRIDPRLEMNRRFCRSWTGQFLVELGRAHFARFHTPLQINSAVRTVEYQRRLLRINGNAAPAEGETASSHLMGGTVDITKKGLSPAEVSWMRAYLLPLQASGKIDVEEEFHQSCFHVAVYKSYGAGRAEQASLRGAALPASGLH